ncbi:hypothetical protein H2201_007185 [Coniosporium apollinis]|uniref:Kelch repeat protein n=1 Tax=Coniosporium apollinis TaxID=61459 RepID=A0ABQ9NRC4_9PEZI|nr:hypothetical protein H2201_007185 [Coniosporium apollinis]
MPSISTTPDLALWKFTADGAGGGSWSKRLPSDPAAFSNLTRPYGATVATGEEVGYALSGVMTSHSDPGFDGDGVPLLGLVSFNMTSGAWRNDSSIGYSSNGMGLWGHMQYVPGFGIDGLLVMFGGQSISPDLYQPGTFSNANPEFIPFDNITIYDPASRTWHSQATTGEHPSPRDSFCAVGVQGANGTYEIRALLSFVHGGWNVELNQAYDELYILSIPAFTWFKADYTPTSPRMVSSCEVVGKRQMLIVGGLDLSQSPYAFSAGDPWRNGLGIFDMAAMTWADEYDADAAAYESPDVVRKWYERGALSSVAWTSPTVRDLFMDRDTIKGSSTSNTLATPTLSATPTSAGQKTPVAAIAGGVVAGVLVLAALAAVVFVRRRNRCKTRDISGGASAALVPHAELSGEPKILEMPVGETGRQKTRAEVHELSS